MSIKSEHKNEMTWKNAKDSLQHALDHFLELTALSKSRKWHHQKWIIMSVHHAASCLAIFWLRAADEDNPLFIGNNGKEVYPHLEDAIKALQKYTGTKHLTEAESDLLRLLTRLNDIRNKFMHRLPPEEINKDLIAYAATSMVGMLHVIERKSGKSFYEQFDQFPEIRKFIMETIHYSKVDEYFAFVEKILKDRGYKYELPECPSCGSRAVIGYHCEACFEDVYEVECPKCNSEFYVQSSYPFEQRCPGCGYSYKEFKT
jgi:hypothetical protein